MDSILAGILLLVFGIALLVYSAGKIVDAGMHIMHLYGLAATTVGVLVLALGTSMPELFVSAIAALRGNEGIAYSEILGSNTANIPLIFGLSIILSKGISIKDHFIARRDAIFLTASTIVAGLLMFDLEVSRADGFVLLCIFAMYIYIVRLTDHLRVESLEIGRKTFHKLLYTLERHSIEVQKRKTIALLIVSSIGLFVGALLTVKGGELLIISAHLSPVLIGLVAIAIGTTLPETAATLAAVRRGQTEMGMANILGDNISSILLALGVASVIHPLHIQPSSLAIDVPAVLLITVLFTLVLFWKQKKVPVWIGVSFLGLYVLILVFYGVFHGSATA